MPLQVKTLPRQDAADPPRTCPPLWPTPLKARNRDQIDADLRTKIRELAQGDGPWPLFLHGQQGSGKTCAGMALVDYAGGSIYVTIRELARAISDANFGRLPFAEYGPTWKRDESDIWTDWARANVCVLDEIGLRSEVRDYEYGVLQKAIDSRIDADKPLVVISNLPVSEVAKVYDARIASRVASGTVVEINGDRRVYGKDYL